MFYETKVLDACGKLKKIISGKELQKRHWENYRILEENNCFAKKLRRGNLKNGFNKEESSPADTGDDTY